MQDHLQVKKSTTQNQNRNVKPVFKPMTLSGQKRAAHQMQPLRHEPQQQQQQYSSINVHSSYISKGLSPLGGDWDVNNEYDPFRPNDYEKVKDKVHRKRQSNRKNSKNEQNFGASLGLDYDDDDEDDDRYKRGDKHNKPRSGATFAPPSSLMEGSDSGISSKNSSQSYSSQHSTKSSGKILDPVANMMAKMGYQPGQGLGREKQGITSALQVEKTGATQGKIILDQLNSSEQDYVEEEPSRVVMLRNMVGPDEVDDALEEEIKDECSKYGKVVCCSIFQVPNYGCVEDAVRIFVEFSRTEYAVKAHTDLGKRYFAGRKVLANFYNERKFHQKIFL